MPFSITAELPLGTYRGARADGGVESIPSVARLYSALLCAAGLGPRAVQVADDPALPWRPCDADEAALRWLEENPPDYVSLPSIEVNIGDGIAYRNDGTVRASRGRLSLNRNQRHPDVSVAVGGPFQWRWSVTPPPQVVAALEALCPDVPHLGTTESPVRLTTGTEGGLPTHMLDSDAGLFSGAGGEDVDLPAVGRLEELREAHEAAQRSAPSQRQDRQGSDERSGSAPPPRGAVVLARYAPLTAPPSDVPWSQVLLLPLERPVSARDRVSLAVATHRAVIAAVSDGVPPLVTGAYPEGGRRPANRLAIQVIDRDMPLTFGSEAPALALLVPRGAEAADLEVLAPAVRSLSSIRSSGRRYRICGPVRVVPGATFWRPPEVGTIRLWRTAVPAVPDTRGVRGHPWSFAHAALLSLAYVWKEHLGAVRGRGDERQLAYVDAVSSAGAAVLRATPIRESDVRPWVHKVHGDAVVRPYHAHLWLGDLAPVQAVHAVGQTRHLGGGLLVPYDVPAAGGEQAWG